MIGSAMFTGSNRNAFALLHQMSSELEQKTTNMNGEIPEQHHFGGLSSWRIGTGRADSTSRRGNPTVMDPSLQNSANSMDLRLLLSSLSPSLGGTTQLQNLWLPMLPLLDDRRATTRHPMNHIGWLRPSGFGFIRHTTIPNTVFHQDLSG
jgi:hypothetical protein